MNTSSRPGDSEADLLELVSALADGQPGTDAIASGVAMDHVLNDGPARSAWRRYHLIGDLMRSADLAAPVRSKLVGQTFSEALMERIAREPALAAAHALPLRRAPAANDAWGWKLIAACASLVAVAVLAWSSLPLAGGGASQARVQASAQSADRVVGQATAPTSAEQPAVMIRDPHLDELLAAHRQFGGTSALQAPAGFLRNAAFEGPGR